MIRGLALPAETLHHAEALAEATERIHAAFQEAQAAQARLETALKPYTVSEIEECRDVRRLGRTLESLGGLPEAIAYDGRRIAGALQKGSSV